MIQFEISEGPNGTDIARVNGAEFRGADALRIAARALVSGGVPDQPWEMRRGDRVDMFGRSLFALAFTSVAETDHGMRTVLWQRHPRAEPDPVLDPLLAEFAVQWRAVRAARRAAP